MYIDASRQHLQDMHSSRYELGTIIARWMHRGALCRIRMARIFVCIIKGKMKNGQEGRGRGRG
jgi:hypothetical protein